MEALLSSVREFHQQAIADTSAFYSGEIETLKAQNHSLREQLETVNAQVNEKQCELDLLKSSSSEKLKRQELHIEKLVKRYCEMSEQLHISKKLLNKEGIDHIPQSLELDAKISTINRLTKDNTRLFHKIAEERDTHARIQAALETKVQTLQEKLGISCSKKPIPLQNTTNVPSKATPTNIPTGSTTHPIEIESTQENTPPGLDTKDVDCLKTTDQIPSIKSTGPALQTPKVMHQEAIGPEKRSHSFVGVERSESSNNLPNHLTTPSLQRTGSLLETPKPRVSLQSANMANIKQPTSVPEKTPIMRPIKRTSSSVEPPKFKYQEVVRDKETRKKMHGIDCPCCSDVL